MFLTAGCKKDGPAATQQKAEAAIDKALDAWVRGESPDKLAGIRIDDPDWKSGARLLGFLTSQSNPVDGNPNRVRCRVSLTLQDRSGKWLDREVEYQVQIGDPTKVERAPS